MPVRVSIGPHRLAGVRRGPERARHGALFVHGWGSDARAADEYATRLADRGWATLGFDLRGHGGSPGARESTSRAEWLDDVVAAYDALSAHGDRITVVGSSFGGYLAACLVDERPVDRLVLRAPADYPDVGFDESGARRRGEYGSTRSIRAVRRLDRPVLVVESELDETIPPWMVARYTDAARHGTHLVQPGAAHSVSKTPALRRAYGDMLLEWLDESDG